MQGKQDSVFVDCACVRFGLYARRIPISVYETIHKTYLANVKGLKVYNIV